MVERIGVRTDVSEWLRERSMAATKNPRRKLRQDGTVAAVRRPASEYVPDGWADDV